MALDEAPDAGQSGHLAHHTLLKAEADFRGVTPAIPTLTSSPTTAEHTAVHNALAANHNLIGGTPTLPFNATRGHLTHHAVLHTSYNLRPQFPHLNVVEDYGATGDGVTDDQTALQDAIDDGDAGSLPVFVPPGTYVHTDRLLFTGAKMFGAMGGQRSILHGTTFENSKIDLQGNGSELHNLTIRGPASSPRTSLPGAVGVYVTNATNYRIINCYIHTVNGPGILGEISSDGVIRYCQVENTAADGMLHAEACHDVEISYCKFGHCGDDALAVLTYSSVTHHFEAHHNTFIGAMENRAMAMNGGNDFNFHHNHIDGGTAGLAISDHYGSVPTTDSSYTFNTVRDINQTVQLEDVWSGGAIHLWNDYPDIYGPMTGITITDNQILNPAMQGIYVGWDSAVVATVGGNAFYSSVPLLKNVNGHAGTVITQSPANTTAAVSSYPGDLIPADVGGMLPDYEYDPGVVF